MVLSSALHPYYVVKVFLYLLSTIFLLAYFPEELKLMQRMRLAFLYFSSIQEKTQRCCTKHRKVGYIGYPPPEARLDSTHLSINSTAYFSGDMRTNPRILGSQLITTFPPSRLPNSSTSSRNPIICILVSTTAVAGGQRNSTSLSFQ